MIDLGHFYFIYDTHTKLLKSIFTPRWQIDIKAYKQAEWRESNTVWTFNDLDLYLMGLLALEKVRPRYLVLHADVAEANLQ